MTAIKTIGAYLAGFITAGIVGKISPILGWVSFWAVTNYLMGYKLEIIGTKFFGFRIRK